MTANLERFTALDDAYNARDWDAYASQLDESFRGWMQGGAGSHDKREHLRAAHDFCAVSADNRVHNTPYVVAFGASEWTCTIARFTGSMTGPRKSPDGGLIEPTGASFDTTFGTIARWADGRIVEEYEFLDPAEIQRQVGQRP